MGFKGIRASVALGTTLDLRGHQFIGFSHFSGFEKKAGSHARELVLTSPVLLSQINFDEVIVSWNAELPQDTYLRAEARALYPSGPTKWYAMGLWSNEPEQHPRESVGGQKDDDGDVSTDTLILARPANSIQVRVILGTDTAERAHLKFLGISLSDTKWSAAERRSNERAWGVSIPVPERSQLVYSNGNVLCSPTTVSMLMSYWGQCLKRADLERDVPEIEQGVYDRQWNGTGNWCFNMAYAGAAKRMRAYVTRFSDFAELEDWISAGIPVGMSVSYDLLHGIGVRPNGHLVVLTGFTASGDPILNDPGTRKDVRRVFQRKRVMEAWGYSHNTVYLVYPEGTSVPHDSFAHWDSWSAKQRIKTR